MAEAFLKSSICSRSSNSTGMDAKLRVHGGYTHLGYFTGEFPG